MATTVDEILVRFLGDTTDFDRARTRFARGLQQIGRAGTMAGAAVTTGFGAIVAGSAAAAASLEQTTIAYDVLVGNVTKSRQLLKDMEQFAKISPFDVGEVEMAGKRLMAMGFAAKEIIPTLKDVGDVTAGIGIGGGRFERIIHNLAQVRTQGKLTARELRDFAVNGVPLLDSLATSIAGLSPNLLEARAQIHDMIRRGQISDMQVLRAFRKMSSAGGKFADLMFKQSKTFLGMLSNIRDSLLITAREIGQVFLPPLKAVASKVLELLDIFRSMDPVVKRLAAGVALIGTVGGIALTALSVAAIAFGAAMLFLGPTIKMFGTFTAMLLSSKIVFASIATVAGGIATAMLQLLNPLSVIIIPVMLIAKGFALMVTPIGLAIAGIAALAAVIVTAKNSLGGWTKLFSTIKDAAFSFAKNVVGFFWNIQENVQSILTWVSTNWRTVFTDIATFLVESLKLAGPVVVQNLLVVSKAILRMTSILFHSIQDMALKTWEYIWSESFVNMAKKALVKFTLNHMLPFLLSLRRAWNTWKFDPLEEWAKANTGPGGFREKLTLEWEQMWKDMESITLAELNFDGPELNLGLEGLFKGVEDWAPDMGNLFDPALDKVNALDKALFKLQHYFNDKEFHISQQGLDFGLSKFGSTPKVFDPDVDTVERINGGGGGIPLTGTGDPMMGAFAGVPSMADILAMPDLPAGPNDEFEFNTPHVTGFGTGLGVLQQPPTVGLIDSVMGPISESATSVLSTVDEAVSTAQTWFNSTTDWLNSTAEDIEKHAPITPVDPTYGSGQGGAADYLTGNTVQNMLYDTQTDMYASGNYSQNDMELMFGGAAWAADGMHADGTVGSINAPIPSGPLQGMTQSVADGDYSEFIPQWVIDNAHNAVSGASPLSDPDLVDTQHELDLLNEALKTRIEKYIEASKDEFLKYIAPPPGTSSYIDEKFYDITPGSVGPGPEYNPGNTGYVPGITGGQFATYGPSTPPVIGGPAPNTYGGVPGLSSTLDQDFATMAGNSLISSILPSWLSPAVNTLNPANATTGSVSVPGQQQTEAVNTPGVLDRLDTLIGVTEANGPNAPNQVEDLGIK